MKIKQILLSPCEFTYVHGYKRLGAILKIESEDGDFGEGDLVPLQERSKETLLQSTTQFKELQTLLTSIEWHKSSFLRQKDASYVT